jgi:hypothetical protein
MPTFGTRSNPAHFVEVPDPSNPGQVMRPPAGTTLMARSHPDGTALPDIVVGDYGYWDLVADPNAITVSGDGGASWVGPLFSVEALTAAITGGLDATTALQQSAEALAAAQQALTAAQQLPADWANHTHAASAITFNPAGSITATDVQAAILQAASMGGGGAGGTSSLLEVFYAGGAYPVQPTTAPTGIKHRAFYGPTPYVGPTWPGVVDTFQKVDLT